LSLISNAIKDAGVIKINSSKDLNVTEINKNISTSKKIKNGLTNKDTDTNSSDNGDIATSDTPGAVSTVNSKGQNAATTVKNGTITSDPVTTNSQPSRSGTKNYVAHGIDNPAAGYLGLANPLYAALNAFTGGNPFSGAFSQATGLLSPFPPLNPNNLTNPSQSYGQQFNNTNNSNNKAELSKEEFKALGSKYGRMNDFLIDYNQSVDGLEPPKNYQSNMDYAKTNDPKLAAKMENFVEARNESINIAEQIGEQKLPNGSLSEQRKLGFNTREFLLGENNGSVSRLEPINQAYKEINQHLKENQYKGSDGNQLTVEDLLKDGKALETSSHIKAETQLSLNLEILDSNKMADLDYDDENKSFNLAGMIKAFILMKN